MKHFTNVLTETDFCLEFVCHNGTAISCSNKDRSKNFPQMEMNKVRASTNFILPYRTQTINNQLSIVLVFTSSFDEFYFVNKWKNAAIHNFQQFTLWTTDWALRRKLELNVIEHWNILRKRNIRSISNKIPAKEWKKGKIM